MKDALFFVSKITDGEVVVLFIKAVFRAGHVGMGKHYEMVRYLVVKDINEVIDLAKIMPRVKKRRGLISCCEITKEQYLAGKVSETLDPYLNEGFAS